MTRCVVLLGDSIFDNAAYVAPEPSVAEQLGPLLAESDRVELRAVDGAMSVDVSRQLRDLPGDATHLVLSVGGNDALKAAGPLLQEPVSSTQEALERLGEAVASFERDYQAALVAVCSAHPTAAVTVCTVYDAVPGLSRAERAGLSVFNDAIVSAAVRAEVAILDLRAVCNEVADYAVISPIEPSSRGGAKIAAAIARVVAASDPATAATWRRRVFL